MWSRVLRCLSIFSLIKISVHISIGFSWYMIGSECRFLDFIIVISSDKPNQLQMIEGTEFNWFLIISLDLSQRVLDLLQATPTVHA